MKFHEWEEAIPAELWELYNDAYGAVIHGVTWNGSIENISGVTKEEALAFAAEFLTGFSNWLDDERKKGTTE